MLLAALINLELSNQDEMFLIRLFNFGFLMLLLGYQQESIAQLVKMENNAPKVNITSPKNNALFSLNSLITYSIEVVDEEDGSTEYNEIVSSEVLLLVRYLPDSLKVKEYLANSANTNPEPLVLMHNSTCFTCHAAKTKLIGPSYDLVAKRYPLNPTSVEMLTNRIISGTYGVWGDVKMPAHPDLKIEQVRLIVNWILKNGADPDQDYYIGTQGAFRIQDKPGTESRKGVYVASASYVDHGIKGQSGLGKLGQHSVRLRISKD